LWASSANWHHKHEDAASALGKLRTPGAVDALYEMTQWVPEYLDFEESRALATKAIWALAGTPGPEAEQALTRLIGSDDEIVRVGAEAQLKRRETS
jgi:HEAT repeat protein